MRIFEALAGSLTRHIERPTEPPPVMICEAEIDRFASTYPQLSRGEILLTMVRFGPKRHAVEDAMRWNACEKMRDALT